MKKTIYDKFGFDKYGYNREGFDRMGYNREGFDRDGYDRNGLNREGINKLTGYDKEGYDRDGYNQDGYNREGIDREGYDREGYNKYGYDKNGYDREGYDQEGYDIKGYNKSGYNREGYDIYGFNEEGYSIDGFSRDLFDEEGYHIYTGFNLKGYNREGYNVNGVDKQGYDKEGYHYENGYNKNGYDRNGYNRKGYNEKGYDKYGYDKDGYDEIGYDKEGYDKNGNNQEGYDRDGYDHRGYDINGFNKQGSMDPELAEKESLMSMDSNQNYLEASFFKKCETQIRGFYKDELIDELTKEFKPSDQIYMDKEGRLQRKRSQPNQELIAIEANKKINTILKNPYFAHIDYNSNPELYIGKQAVHGWITDWADEQASLYYQYQMYIGNKDIGLDLVRDIIFSDKKYKSYKDLYNKNITDGKIRNIADERLSQIIEMNQENKEIHDIIETIQQNQYEIITTDKDISTLVLGCAGSGKTMILMHKIRYMKYNNQDLNMQNIMVISPTNVLSLESKKLSDILQINNIQQFNIARFYEKCCKELLTQIDIPYEEFQIIEDAKVATIDYNWVIIEELKEKIYYKLNDDVYYDQQEKYIKEELEDQIIISGLEKETVRKMAKLYEQSLKEINKASKNDIKRILQQIEYVISKREIYENMQDLIGILKNDKIFKKSKVKSKLKQGDIDKIFFRTINLVEAMNFHLFLKRIDQKKIKDQTAVQYIQIMQLFTEPNIELEEIHKVLNEWCNISEEDAELYIEYVGSALERMDILERKQEILQELLDKNCFKDIQKENNSLNYDKSFEKIVKLFDCTEAALDEIEYTPFDYFDEYYKIERKYKRLMEHRKNPRKRYYLFDTILDTLDIEYRLSGDIYIPLSKAYEVTYILYCCAGKLCEEKRYIFIDEFQDLSNIELKLIHNLYPNAVFNLFGDLNQCINKKGIKIIEEVPEKLYDHMPKLINENYRNAKQITEYVNKELGTQMLPVGLNGIQQNVTGIPRLDIMEDDRVAIIMKDNYSADLALYKHNIKFNLYSKSNEIKRGVYNVITVSMAKGLEFEKVIVVEHGMTKNQFYVACTRAIKELYIIPGNISNQTVQVVENDGLLKKKCKNNKFYGYELVLYQGKLKKVLQEKQYSKEDMSIVVNNQEKKIPVSYIEKDKIAYIYQGVYEEFKEEIDKCFGTNNLKEEKSTLNKIQENSKKRCLDINIYESSKITDIVELFEGISNGEHYDRLILRSELHFTINDGHLEKMDFVIERQEGRAAENGITFTELKEGEIFELRKYMRKQFTEDEYKLHRKTGTILKFKTPYVLRTKKKNEFGQYVIVGIYVKKYM